MSTRNDGRIRPGGMTRRGFLKGAGVTAVGTAIGESALVALAEQSDKTSASVLGPGPVKISLDINGQKRSLDVEPRMTLADCAARRFGHDWNESRL